MRHEFTGPGAALPRGSWSWRIIYPYSSSNLGCSLKVSQFRTQPCEPALLHPRPPPHRYTGVSAHYSGGDQSSGPRPVAGRPWGRAGRTPGAPALGAAGRAPPHRTRVHGRGHQETVSTRGGSWGCGRPRPDGPTPPPAAGPLPQEHPRTHSSPHTLGPGRPYSTGGPPCGCPAQGGPPRPHAGTLHAPLRPTSRHTLGPDGRGMHFR